MRENALLFTPDNFVLSLPLIITTALYAFFKFIPLPVGVPLLIAGGVFLQARAKLRKRQDLQSNEMDESVLKELSADDDKKKAKQTAAALKRERKAADKLRRRITSDKASAETGDIVETKEDEEEDVERVLKKQGRRK
mmetsp:Transcript_21705/g.47308  ORF Transcript_21705/g.47308 Transcript_21705/m.47308 type:complete len:138 (-) Transcript_21705:2083-2496(-)